MNIQTGWLLIAAGMMSVLVGMTMVSASQPRDVVRRMSAARRLGRPLVGLGGAVTCTSVASAVIVGVQWAVVSQAGSTVAWAVALGVPAFLAGTTVARLCVAMRIAFGRWRRARAFRRTDRGRG